MEQVQRRRRTAIAFVALLMEVSIVRPVAAYEVYGYWGWDPVIGRPLVSILVNVDSFRNKLGVPNVMAQLRAVHNAWMESSGVEVYLQATSTEMRPNNMCSQVLGDRKNLLAAVDGYLRNDEGQVEERVLAKARQGVYVHPKPTGRDCRSRHSVFPSGN